MGRILVTGGCGFLGTELCKQLVKKDHNVTIVDNLSKPGSSVNPAYQFFKVDLTEKEATEELFRRGNFNVCIHLAAKVGGVGYLDGNPATIISKNNDMYSSVFQAAADNKVGRMVFISSSMALKGDDSISQDNDNRQTSIYGLSKLIGEHYCSAFKREFGLNYSICRPFNIYGVNDFPGDKVGDSHVIPDLIKKALSNAPEMEILGDGQQTRCFTHISDLSKAIIQITESKSAENEDFNISAKEEIKIYDVAKKIWYMSGRTEEFAPKHLPGFASDVKKRTPDTSKIERILGWKPEISFDDGLKEVVDWFKAKYEKKQ